MVLTFRRATVSDIETLRRLAAAIWRSYYPAIISPGQIDYMLETMYAPDVIQKELTRGVVWEVVGAAGQAGQAGRVGHPGQAGQAGRRGTAGGGRHRWIGFLSYEEEAGRRVKLHKVYLLPELHGRGAGRQMIERVRRAASRMGAREIYLQVNKRNTRAIRAYERAGFAITGRLVVEIGRGFVMDDYVMSGVVEAGAGGHETAETTGATEVHTEAHTEATEVHTEKRG